MSASERCSIGSVLAECHAQASDLLQLHTGHFGANNLHPHDSTILGVLTLFIAGSRELRETNRGHPHRVGRCRKRIRSSSGHLGPARGSRAIPARQDYLDFAGGTAWSDPHLKGVQLIEGQGSRSRWFPQIAATCRSTRARRSITRRRSKAESSPSVFHFRHVRPRQQLVLIDPLVLMAVLLIASAPSLLG